MSTRKREAEATSLTWAALQANFPSLLLNQSLGDGQSQPCPFLCALTGTLNLPKFLKDHLLVFWADPNASIRNRDEYQGSILTAIDLHSSPLRSEFNRIAKKVVEDLLKADSVCINRTTGPHSLLDIDFFCHCQRPDCRQHLRQTIANVEVFASQLQLSGLDLGKI